MAYQIHNQGKAAEYMVAAHILMRGGEVAWPAVDQGYDLIGPSGCRVQVKSSHLSTKFQRSYPEGVYSFGLTQRGNQTASKKRSAKTLQYSDRSDVVVLYGIEHNRYWVAPSYILDGVWSVLLGPDSSRAFEKHVPDMLRMKDEGMTLDQIGKVYGVGGTAILRRLERAGTEMHIHTASVKVRKCENAWGYILNFPTLDPELNVIITPKGGEVCHS